MKTSKVITDALPETISYDQQSKRYRNKDSGKFISREASINIQKQYLEKITLEFIDLAPSLINGDISAQIKAAQLLKNIHVSNAIISANGMDNLSQSDLGYIGSILKKQYYAGIGDDGGKFGLRHLFRDTEDLSEAQLRNRLRMFAQSGELSGQKIKESKYILQGYDIERRVLGAAHKHCPECLEYAGRGWEPIGQLPKPMTECSCYSNCVCSLEYGKSSEDL